MRRKDLSGANECMGATLSMRSRISCRFSGRKMSMLLRLVKRRVLDGGVGWINGGRSERSRLRLALLREEVEDDLEGRGVGSIMKSELCGCEVAVVFVWL